MEAGGEKMSQVVLVRVDSRLIHGQVVLKCLKETKAKRILIVDDTICQDPLMVQIFTMAAPDGVRIDLCDTKAAGQASQAGTLAQDMPTIVLFKHLEAAQAAYQAGFHMQELGIGSVGGGPGRVNVTGAVTMSRQEAQAADWLMEQGVHVTLQGTVEDTLMDWKDVREQFSSHEK